MKAIEKLLKQMRIINIVSSIIAFAALILAVVFYRQGRETLWQVMLVLGILGLDFASNSSGYMLGMNTVTNLLKDGK